MFNPIINRNIFSLPWKTAKDTKSCYLLKSVRSFGWKNYEVSRKILELGRTKPIVNTLLSKDNFKIFLKVFYSNLIN